MARSKQTAGLSWTLEPARVEQELLATATSAGDLRRPRTSTGSSNLRGNIVETVMLFRGFLSVLALTICSATFAAESIAPLGAYTPVERRHWAFRSHAHPEIPKF